MAEWNGDWHISPRLGMKAAKCYSPNNCDYGYTKNEHYKSESDANVAAQEKTASQHGGNVKSHIANGSRAKVRPVQSLREAKTKSAPSSVNKSINRARMARQSMPNRALSHAGRSNSKDLRRKFKKIVPSRNRMKSLFLVKHWVPDIHANPRLTETTAQSVKK